MKVLIMAAGIGSRISRHLNGQPKCCVKIGDTPLIRYTVELLNKKGINDIALVTGYSRSFIIKALKGLKYKLYTNPFFDVTNSIASAWFAKDFLESNDDYIIMNGDVFIEDNILDILLENGKSPLFLADSTRIEDADYRFNWENNKLIKYGKELSIEETTGEYVGIAKISKNDIDFMKQKLEYFINIQKHNFWWEDIFYRSLEEKDVCIYDIKGNFWAEVDYIEDYERIQNYIKGKNNE
ncbi:phosphocholine cytidylyltransferase family protein [Aliarcobacter cryaerophilus]|uniref:phosphocholine cytidylyltransferase family protein n=1 Tax=Aliarcobacter cryaerophilus TaxID=28198 RepID=UPI0021B35544|nr:phosphocholine cytidylyltransferase family protein [Aliarcobacter cryaerophilus]MCT7522582.1 phosphocholine cytidylyltransferase family protein [Aliarcobacter cryaerophilus]